MNIDGLILIVGMWAVVFVPIAIGAYMQDRRAIKREALKPRQTTVNKWRR